MLGTQRPLRPSARLVTTNQRLPTTKFEAIFLASNQAAGREGYGGNAAGVQEPEGLAAALFHSFIHPSFHPSARVPVACCTQDSDRNNTRAAETPSTNHCVPQPGDPDFAEPFRDLLAAHPLPQGPEQQLPFPRTGTPRLGKVGGGGGQHLTSSWTRPRGRVGVGSWGFWTQRVGVVLDGQATCSPEKATGPRGSQPLRVPQGQAEGRGGRGIKCNPAP